MTQTIASDRHASFAAIANPVESSRLLKGEILLQTQPHSTWGGCVTAQMHVPQSRERVWSELSNYPRWVDFFPDVTRSEVLSSSRLEKRLLQAASKSFLFLTVQVEVILRVRELYQMDGVDHIQFRLEEGSFSDFSADLQLVEWQQGTLLSYTVRATPLIPMPTPFVQQAMRLDLPANMQRMRQVLCS